MVNYLCVDTETTGLNNDAQVLTAFFIILDSNFNEIDTLDLKIRYPVYNVELKAFSINKINLSVHDKSALDLLDAKNTLNTFLKKHYNNKKYIALGHNVKFDLDKLSKKFDIYYYVNNIFSLDTMQIAQFFKSSKQLLDTQSLSLKNLTEYYNIESEGELHNAEYDIKLTIELFKHFQNLLKNTTNTIATNTISTNTISNVTNTNVTNTIATNTTTQTNTIARCTLDENKDKLVVDILLSLKNCGNGRVLRQRSVVKYF